MAVESEKSARSAGALLWAVLNLAQFLFVVFWAVLWISIALVVLAVTRSRSTVFFFARKFFGPGMVWSSGSKLEVVGLQHLPTEGACFFASNHQSAIDIPALYAALPRPLHYILKEELRSMPFVGWFASAVGMIFVDRGDRKKSLESLKRAGELIRSGKSVICFPEGTRSRDGSILPFKTGVFAAAIASGVPVYPVCIQGARIALPPDGFHPRPALIRIEVGPPIETADLDPSDRSVLSERVRDGIVALLAARA